MARKIKTEAEIAERINRRYPAEGQPNIAKPNTGATPPDDGDEYDDEDDDLRNSGGEGEGEGNGDQFHGEGDGHEGLDGDEDGDRDVLQELADLRQQLASMQNRVAPVQRTSEEHRRRAEEAERRLQQAEQERQQEIEELRQQLEEYQSAPPPIEDLLTPEEQELFDPAQLAVVTKLASEMSRRAAPKIDVRSEVARTLQQREAEQVAQYRTEVIMDPSRGLDKLATLTNDPRFQAWANHEDNEIFNITMHSLLNATSTREIDRLAKSASRQIGKYHESIKADTRRRRASAAGGQSQQDARTSRVAHAARRNQPRRSDPSTEEATLSEIKRLMRSRNPADKKRAGELLASIDS